MLDVNRSKVIFPICHLFVLLSACVNPVLYGWLNTNFRDQFTSMLHGYCFCCKGQDRVTSSGDTRDTQLCIRLTKYGASGAPIPTSVDATTCATKVPVISANEQ
jgi:hypothetical protein